MTVSISYKLSGKEHVLLLIGDDIEVGLLTNKGIDIKQIPEEEGIHGFRAKEVEE